MIMIIIIIAAINMVIGSDDCFIGWDGRIKKKPPALELLANHISLWSVWTRIFPCDQHSIFLSSVLYFPVISSVVPCDQHSILWSAWTRGESKVVFYNSRHSLIVTSERSGNRLRSKPVFALGHCSDHQIRCSRFPLQVDNIGWGGGNIDSPWSEMNISWSIDAGVDITHFNLLSLYCRRVLKFTLIWI